MVWFCQLPICVVATLLSMALSAGAHAQQSAYEWEYGYQMGPRAPDVKHINDAIPSAHDGAVYANRQMAEFAIVAWNFPPSDKPFRFQRNVQPLEPNALEHIQSTNVDGYIVVKDGVIIHEHYGKGMYPTTRHATYSAGKSWASATWHKPLLSVMDRRVSDVIRELSGSLYGRQTVRDIVDMRSPVLVTENYDDPNSTINQSGRASGWEFSSVGEAKLIPFLSKIEKDPKLEDGEWKYASPSTMLLAIVGSRVAGLHQYEGAHAFRQAIGTEHISGTIANFNGEMSSEGGQFFTLRDFVKLAYAMASDGVIDGRQVLDRRYITDVFSVSDEKQQAFQQNKDPFGSVLRNSGINYYSNKWWVVDGDIALAAGSYGQFLVVNRKTNVAIAKFSTYPTGQAVAMAASDVRWLIEQASKY